MRASEGVVAAARLSGAAIIPVCCAASRRKVLQSWDRFQIPLPFCRGEYRWGEPIRVPRDADKTQIEAARQQVEDALMAITCAADDAVGQTTILPQSETGPIEADPLEERA